MFKLETEPERLTRASSISSPAGKAALLIVARRKQQDDAVERHRPTAEPHSSEVILFVLLVDERPRKSPIPAQRCEGEVVASSSDETAENHIQIAEGRARTGAASVEMKQDVVILCDSITRCQGVQQRAARIRQDPLRRIDARTMEKPRASSARRATRKTGSLTIIATALVDPARAWTKSSSGVKGTGNTEICSTAVYSSGASSGHQHRPDGTRKEEKLLLRRCCRRPHAAARAGRERSAERDEDAAGTAAEVSVERRVPEELLGETPRFGKPRHGFKNRFGGSRRFHLFRYSFCCELV